MARAQYFVVLHEDQWKILFDGKHYGPYKTQADAIAEATRTAREAGRLGNDSQVLVQGTDGRFRAEWTYGVDPYPPAG